MSFRNNLQHLRATRNMTQEQLAMLVGVSRQSVTKWEAEKAYPEMDKLLKLCQIFDCSLDDLVQGDLTARAPEPELAVPTAALAEDVIGYDEHQRTFARRVGAGVGLCVVGLACASFFEIWERESLQALGLFGFVAAGLAFIIPSALEHTAFQKAHPYVANFYTDDERIEGKRAFGKQLVSGIALIFAGIISGSFVEGTSYDFLTGILFFTCMAIGSGLIVYAALLNNRLDIEDYNLSSLEEFSEEEIAGIVGEERALSVLEKVRRNRRSSTVCGVIMLVATAIALPLMFWATDFGEPFWSRFFWIPWMVGGLLCAAASIIIEQKS